MLIITYHAIEPLRSPVAVTRADLESHISGLGAAGFRFVSMDSCADWLAGRADLPERSVALTFDDGYESVVERALPVLAAREVPAMLYAIGGRLGSDNQWAGQWPGIGRMRLADVARLREWISAGLDLGNHSWTHPRLPAIDEAGLADEIDMSADRLQQTFGRPIVHFAYPYGVFAEREVEAARRRHRTAVTTEVRAARPTDNPHRLPRIDGQDVGLALRLGLTQGRGLDWYLACRRAARQVRRALDGAASGTSL